MAFIEMARDEVHGGGDWAFSKCIFSPNRNKSGGQSGYWEKILRVREGDVIVHLRGVPPNAYFVGASTAACDGFETNERPPDPGTWGFAERFYRADLQNYTPFETPIKLETVFEQRKLELEAYFDRAKIEKKARPKVERNLFYVRQSRGDGQPKVLQCQNGAYLSDLDFELAGIILDEVLFGKPSERTPRDAVTSSQVREVKVRVGQREFSDNVRLNYAYRCCFPDCPISDDRFLVGSHIARWSDNPALRGSMGNGLCLCVFHDRAFELGHFTFDANSCVRLNQRFSGSTAFKQIAAFSGQLMRGGKVPPLPIALSEHRNRILIEQSH